MVSLIHNHSTVRKDTMPSTFRWLLTKTSIYFFAVSCRVEQNMIRQNFATVDCAKWLIDNYMSLVRKGYHFIADFAYGIKSFLHTPYDNGAHGSMEDNYNFFHSSSRICVECCFGEIDLWFGIFWRPLKFSLKFNYHVIDACFRLHNFIVKHRESTLANDNMDPEIRENSIGPIYWNLDNSNTSCSSLLK